MKIAINAIRVTRKGGGGIDHYIIHLVNQLAKMGVEFDLFTVAPHHFTQVNPKQIRNPIILFGDLIRLIWTQIFFPFYLLFGKYDLVFSPSQIDALPFSPIKQVITVLDLIPFLFTEQKHKHLFYLKTFFPIALKKAEHIIAISKNTKNDIIQYFHISESKVTAIPIANPVENIKGERPSTKDIERVKENYKLGQYIFCLSNNDPHKNLGRLIEAFGLIKEWVPFNLVIAGYQNPSHQEVLDRLVLDKKMEGRVQFLGHIKPEDLPALYCGSEIFVYPSLYEGFGLPPLEAISYGIPTLVSQSSSLPEVIGEAGLTFDPQSVKDLSDQMLKLLLNDALKTKLKNLGIKQAGTFTWEKTAYETIKVLTQAICPKQEEH